MDTKVHHQPDGGASNTSQVLKLPKITSVTTVTNTITTQTATQYPNSDRFRSDVEKLESKLEANEKCDKELHEVKGELIKVIVYTMMHNR